MHLAQRFGAREFAKTNLVKKRPKFPWKKPKTNRETQEEHDLSVTSKFKSRIKANNNQMCTNAVVLYRTSKQIRALEKQIQELQLEAGNVKRQLAEKNMQLKPRERRLYEQKRLLSRQSRELDELRSANSETYYFGEALDDNTSDANKSGDEVENAEKSVSDAPVGSDFTGVDLDQVWYPLGSEFGAMSA